MFCERTFSASPPFSSGTTLTYTRACCKFPAATTRVKVTRAPSGISTSRKRMFANSWRMSSSTCAIRFFILLFGSSYDKKLQLISFLHFLCCFKRQPAFFSFGHRRHVFFVVLHISYLTLAYHLACADNFGPHAFPSFSFNHLAANNLPSLIYQEYRQYVERAQLLAASLVFQRLLHSFSHALDKLIDYLERFNRDLLLFCEVSRLGAYFGTESKDYSISRTRQFHVVLGNFSHACLHEAKLNLALGKIVQHIFQGLERACYICFQYNVVKFCFRIHLAGALCHFLKLLLPHKLLHCGFAFECPKYISFARRG